MKHKLHLYLLICLLYPSIVWSQSSRTEVLHIRDSLRAVIDTAKGEGKLIAYEKLRYLYDSQPVDESTIQELLRVSDELDAEAKRQNNPIKRGVNMINTIVHLRNSGQWEKVYERAPNYLAYLKESGQWNFYYGIQGNLLNSYLYNNKIETTIRKARQLYDESVVSGQEIGAGIALCTIGRAYREQRRFNEATAQFKQGLALLEKQEKVTPLLLENYWTYCGLFLEDKDYEKALDGTRHFDEALERYQKQANRQIPSYQAIILRLYAHAYAGLKKPELAEETLDKANQLDAENINVIGQTNNAMIRSEISLDRRNYTLALNYIDEAQRLHIPKRDYIEISLLRSKADILARLNRPTESFAASEAAFELADTLSFHTFSAQIEELRTQYETDKYIAEKERNFHYFLFALVGCLLLALVLISWIYYSRMLLKKNRTLFRQIKEQDRMAAELDRMRKHEQEITPDIGGTSQQQELTNRLHDYLLQDKNFGKPDIARSEIAASLATNRTTLSEAVKTVTGKTLMEYARSIQLEEAKKMLETQPTLTIETIAGECGFNTPRTFYRNFREQYNISPSEYRKLSQEQNPHE